MGYIEALRCVTTALEPYAKKCFFLASLSTKKDEFGDILGMHEWLACPTSLQLFARVHRFIWYAINFFAQKIFTSKRLQ